MKSGLKVAFFLLVASAIAVAARIPPGAQIQIELTKEINTSASKVGDPFEAVVIAPVVANGNIGMAAGVIATGHAKEVIAAVNPDDQALLPLVSKRAAGVDNARESLDSDGC